MVTQSQPQLQQQKSEREPKSRFIIKANPGLSRFTLRYRGWKVGTFSSIDDCRQRMDLIDNIEWMMTRKDRAKEGWGIDLAVAVVLLVVVLVAVLA